MSGTTDILQTGQDHCHEAEIDMIPTIEEWRNLKTSVFYQALPAMVRNRMPHLPSIRQSISDLRRTRPLCSKNDSIVEASLPQIAPPEYAPRLASGSTTPYRHTTNCFDFDDDISIASSALSTPPLILPYETSTGISWQHARHGVVAMEQAHRQASVASEDDIKATIIRSQYVHSLTLFLRSLPPTLTSAERMSLYEATPQNILELYNSAPQDMALAQAEHNGQDMPERTLLWRLTAWLILKMFILVQILLPYIKLLLMHAARLESEHQITRRIFNTGVAVGSGFSRECWKVSRAVCQMNDGMLGDVVSEAVIYCAESIGGGIQQGLAEARSQQHMKRKKREITVSR